jgi:hypothetical protein
MDQSSETKHGDENSQTILDVAKKIPLQNTSDLQ